MKLQEMLHTKMQSSFTNPLASRAKIGHYPSAASLIIELPVSDSRVFNKIVGSCNRSEYYKWNNYEKTGETNSESIRRMSYGKILERYELNLYKELGIYHSSNVKFIHQYPDLHFPVSGEIDAAIYDRDNSNEVVGVEIKTVHDYYGRKGCIISTRDTPLFPKDNHILQVMLYLDHFKDALPEIPITKFKLVYIDRGNGQDREHDLSLSESGNLIVSNNDVTDQEYPQFNMQKVVGRLKSLEDHLLGDTLPPKDCREQYSKEDLEDLMVLGELSKTHIAEMNAGRTPKKGDWQCSYCNYKELCQADKK